MSYLLIWLHWAQHGNTSYLTLLSLFKTQVNVFATKSVRSRIIEYCWIMNPPDKPGNYNLSVGNDYGLSARILTTSLCLSTCILQPIVSLALLWQFLGTNGQIIILFCCQWPLGMLFVCIVWSCTLGQHRLQIQETLQTADTICCNSMKHETACCLPT